MGEINKIFYHLKKQNCGKIGWTLKPKCDFINLCPFLSQTKILLRFHKLWVNFKNNHTKTILKKYAQAVEKLNYCTYNTLNI